MSDPHIPEPGSAEWMKAQVEADEELIRLGHDPNYDVADQQEEEARRLNEARQKLREGFETLVSIWGLKATYGYAQSAADYYKALCTRDRWGRHHDGRYDLARREYEAVAQRKDGTGRAVLTRWGAEIGVKPESVLRTIKLMQRRNRDVVAGYRAWYEARPVQD
jgi:hypothetical protein